MFKIGQIEITYPAILAPMAGITDLPFRTICKEMGASLMYTEFVSAEGIIRENTKTLDMIKFTDKERPLGVQIFGDDPEVVGKSAKYIYDNFKPDIIDINYGCPVPKVTKKGGGSAALRDLTLMSEITSSVVENVPNIPVTAKMRAGWDMNSIVAVEAGIMLEKIGIKALTLHARTTKQGFSGHSNWSIIKDLKSNIKIPVIGNGDVWNLDDYHSMMSETNCDAVMIGSGAFVNAWIFKEIKNYYDKKTSNTRTMVDLINVCIKHVSLLEKNKNEIGCINLSKKHLNFYIKNFKDSSMWRKKIMSFNDINEIKNVLEEMKSIYIEEKSLY